MGDTALLTAEAMALTPATNCASRLTLRPFPAKDGDLQAAPYEEVLVVNRAVVSVRRLQFSPSESGMVYQVQGASYE